MIKLWPFHKPQNKELPDDRQTRRDCKNTGEPQSVADNIPKHIAIIMDGNGRWAKAKGKMRHQGHEAGVDALRRTVDAAADMGVQYLTVYSFSTENWSRPAKEIDGLFRLLKLYVERDLQTLKVKGVRVRILGERGGLSEEICEIIDRVHSETETNTKYNLNIAFNYGGRADIMGAVKSMAEQIQAGDLTIDDITEARFSRALATSDQPEPDLLIRTSGEYRLSNFLIWQSAYSEFVFTDVLWPDFGAEDLHNAVRQYQTRKRRFGGLDENTARLK